MATKEEETNRLKWKLKLYGSYTREYEEKQRRYFKIEQELTFNDDIRKAAKNMGIYSNDPYHPADEKLQIEYASLKNEMEELCIERSYLGLDLFIESLPKDEWKLLNYIYVKGLTQIKGGDKVGMCRSTIRRKLDDIYEKFLES